MSELVAQHHRQQHPRAPETYLPRKALVRKRLYFSSLFRIVQDVIIVLTRDSRSGQARMNSDDGREFQ